MEDVMTEETLNKAKEISEKLRRCKNILHQIEVSKNYASHFAIFKIKDTSIEVEIPDELRKTILDVLFAHYEILAAKTQKEFDEL
jgi:hypothetical protein